MSTDIEKSIDSKYVQQHLANERTFLAWIRTGITISGLGFLSIGVVFRSSIFVRAGHTIAAVFGIGAVLLGAFIMILAASDYFRKRKGINQETFLAPRLIIWILLLGLALIELFLLMIILLIFV
jgi:putative membrane protein